MGVPVTFFGIAATTTPEYLPLKNIRMEQLGQLDKKEQYDRFKKWLFMKEKPIEMTGKPLAYKFYHIHFNSHSYKYMH